MKTAKYIADRIRLFIATKQFQIGDVLPSTRQLGKQLDTSFHTVRKAYQMLTEEGLLRSEKGKGFIVNRQNTGLDKSERLEKGAEQMRVLLEELIGYGLDEDEVESLFQEQLRFMDWPGRLESCATVGSTYEHGQILSQAIQKQVGVKSSVITITEMNKSVNYDALFVPIQYFRKFREETDNILLLPIFYNIGSDLLLAVIERQDIQTIGLVTSEEETIPSLIDELKLNLKFQGSMMAGSTYGKSLPLLVREVDVVIYTPACASLIEKQVPENKRLRLNYTLHTRSADLIRAELWDQ
ncbi:MAG: GntR family transcriptional regulator [Balneolales bacterium]